ncbi:MAG: DUF4276 family protein [bacterium]|nr:DUF4276 family protein [bacterium]
MKKNKPPKLNRPKIVLLVPGESEYQVLPYILRLFNLLVSEARKTEAITFRNQQLRVSPKVFRQVEAALKRKPEKIVLVFDREDNPQCPGEFAEMVRDRIEEQVNGITARNFSVICADHMVENWVLADQEVFNCKLFEKKEVANRVKNRADCQDAIKILRDGFYKNNSYHKTKHLPSLAKSLKMKDPQIKKRSPSFAKFLRELGL